MQELKVKLNLPWMDAVHGVPSNMIRVSPLDKYKGEYFVQLWLEDTREMISTNR